MKTLISAQTPKNAKLASSPALATAVVTAKVEKRKQEEKGGVWYSSYKIIVSRSFDFVDFPFRAALGTLAL